MSFMLINTDWLAYVLKVLRQLLNPQWPLTPQVLN